MDEREWRSITNLLEYALKQGVDRVKLLDTYGKLHTAARHKESRLEALRELRTAFDQLQAHEMARLIAWGRPMTADDMFRAVTMYLDDYISNQEKEET